MLFGRHPELTITPATKIPQLLHLDVIVLIVVLDRQALGVVDAHVNAKTKEDPTDLIGE